MSDKPIAGLLTAIAVAPLCLVCALGPAAFVAAGGGVLAWLGGLGVPLLVASTLAIGSWLAWRAFQRRSAPRGAAKGEPAYPLMQRSRD
jgi:hypothetical protein